MKKHYHITILFCILLFHYGCDSSTHNKDNSYDIIKVDIDNAKPGRLSDFYKSIRYIKLETRASCYLPPCQMMEIVDDKIYLGSHYPYNKIFVFNTNGKYLFQIGSIGKGPEEWLSMESFIVDNGYVTAIDGGSNSYLRFDIKGNFIEKKRMNNIIINSISEYKGDTVISYINNNTIFNNGKEINSNLIFFSLKKQRIYAESIPIPDYKFGFHNIGIDCLPKIENIIYYYDVFVDTIYKIGENFNVIPRFVLDFGKYAVTPEKRPKSLKDYKKVVKMHRKFPGLVYYVHGLTGTKNTLFFGFARAINRHPYLFYVYYSLNTKTSKCVTKLIDDLSLPGIKMEFTAKNPLTSVNGEQIWMIEPAEFLEEYNKLKNKYGIETLRERNPQLTKIFENTTDMDNPILVFLKFKE